MDAALQEAQDVLTKRFGAVTVADLADDFERRRSERPPQARRKRARQTKVCFKA